jgi:hypothetical protein
MSRQDIKDVKEGRKEWLTKGRNKIRKGGKKGGRNNTPSTGGVGCQKIGEAVSPG